MKIIGIILLVLFVLYLLSLVLYLANADGKMIQKVYDWLIKMHDKKNVEEKI